MRNNASLLDEILKDQQAATMPKPIKPSGTKAVLSQGTNLGMGVDRFKGDIEYLKDNTDEGASGALGITASTSSIASAGTKVAEKGIQKGTKVLANKILQGNTPKNITDVTKLTKVGGNLGKVASGLGAVASVASFGKQVYDEVGQSSALHTGRGFEGAGEQTSRAASLVSSGVTAAAAVGSTVAAVTGSVAAANFWNPIGWAAAAVGLVSAGVGWLANKSKLGGGGRRSFLGQFKPGKIAGRR